MVFRDIDKKALIDNAATVSSKITIVGTDITFTEDDFISEWDYEDYRYVPENGFIGQFVERIFDGKLKDLPNDINIENKEINLQIGINNGITGETTYYDYGNFIVTKIGEQDTTGISTFESADYTKKFNAEYVDSLTYPCLALELANSACEQAGVELATKGYAYCYAVPKEGLVAGTYRFLIDNTSYEFVISENLNFYDSIMYIVDENKMVLKRVNEDFSITRTDLDYKLTTSSTSTELKVRKTGYYDFINNDFVIENNQFESTDTLREVIKSVAKLAYTWVRVGTDNKVYLDFKKKTSSSYSLTINGKSENKPLLPDGYTQVDYLESNKTQYIDTGYKPNQNTRVDIRFESIQSDNEYYDVPFGTRDNSDTTQFFLGIQTGANENWFARYGKNAFISGWGNKYGYNTLVANKNEWFLTNGTHTFPENTFQSEYTMYLFGLNYAGNFDRKFKGRIYSCKIYDNGTLVRDFVPCYRNSDKVLGMYDAAKNTFYTNNGAGTFTYGKVVSTPNPDFPREIMNGDGATNLLYLDNVSGYKNGIYYKWEGTKLTLNGTATANTDIYNFGHWGSTQKHEKRLIKPGTYTLSIKDKSHLQRFSISMYYDTTTHVIGIYNSHDYDVVKTFQNEVYYSNCYASIVKGVTFENETFYLQLEKGDRAHDYVPYGRWLSIRTNSDNLANTYNINRTTAGLKVKSDNEGKMFVSGTATATYGTVKRIDYIKPIFKKGDKVSMSWGSTKDLSQDTLGNPFVWFRNKSGATVSSLARQLTTTTINDDIYYIFIGVENYVKGSSYNESMYMSLVKSTTKPEVFEPYKENTALIDMNKKDLFKDGVVRQGRHDASGATNRVSYISNAFYPKGTTFTIKNNSSLICGVAIVERQTQDCSLLDDSGWLNKNIYTFTSTSDGYLTINMKKSDESNITPSVVASGDYNIYIDVNANPYYSIQANDTFKDGKYIQTRAKYTFTGDETLVLDDVYNGVAQFAYLPNAPGKYRDAADKTINILSNYFKGRYYGESWKIDNCVVIRSKGYIRMMTSKYTTLDEFKAYLKEKYQSGTPVIVEYELETPIEHTLNYETLQLFDDKNNISLNDEILESDDFEVIEDKITIDDYYETEKQPELYGPVNKVLLGMSTVDGENVYKDKLVDKVDSSTIYGNGKRETRSGKNKIKLLDKTETTKNGITYSVKDDILTINGTVTGSTIIDATQILYDLGTTPKSFTLNVIPISGVWSSGVMGISSRNATNYDSYQLQWHQSQSGKLSVSKEYSQEVLDYIKSMWLYINKDSVFSNYKCRLQLTEGTEADNVFEQYGASPTSEFPSEFEVVEGVTNLLNLEAETSGSVLNGLTSKINEDGSVTITGNGTSTWSNITKAKYTNITPNEKYTFSIDKAVSFRATINVGYTDNTYDRFHIESGNTRVSVMAAKEVKDCYVYVYKADGLGEISETLRFQLEKGDRAHDYVPYGRWLEVKSTGKNLVKKVTTMAQKAQYNSVMYINGDLKPNTTYTLSLIGAKDNEVYVNENVFSKYRYLKFDGTRQSITVTTRGDLSENLSGAYVQAHGWLILKNAANQPKDNLFIDVQIEEGSIATPYEQYKENKSLIDMNKHNMLSHKPSDWVQGTTEGLTTPSIARMKYKHYILIEANKKYRMTINNPNYCFINIDLYDGNKKYIDNYYIQVSSSINGARDIVVTFPSTVNYIRPIIRNVNDVDTMLPEYIVDIKPELLDYSDPYYELSKMPNGLEDSLQDGIITKRVGKIVLDGSQPLSFDGTGIDSNKTVRVAYYNLLNDLYIAKADDANIVCTHAPGKIVWDIDEEGIYVNKRSIVIRLNKSTISGSTTVTTQEFNAWASANPITIYYTLVNPITHTIKKPVIKLHKGYNHITTNDNLEPKMNISISDIDNNVTTYSGNTITTVLSDNKETSLQIWDNPLTYTEDLRKIALNGSESLFGVRYTPMTTQTVGHPWLEASDYVKLTNLSNQTLYTYPLDRKLSYKGYIKSDISSKAPTLTEQKYEFNGDTDTRLKKTQISVDKANQKITAIASDISDTNEKVSQLTITTGEIKTEVSQKVTKTELNNSINTAVDNIEVGGRNLFVKKNLQTISVDSWVWNGYTLSCTCSKGSAGPKFNASLFTVGEIYTLSFKFKKTSGTLKNIGGHNNGFRQQAFYVDGVKVSSLYIQGHALNDTTDTHNVSVTLEYRGTDSVDNNLYIQVNRGLSATPANFDIWDIKLEKGNKPTDWSPAPEDVDNNIDKAKNDAINSANTATDNKLKNYSTTTQMNSAITQKADSILSTVSTTYTTKEESANDIANAVNNINVGGRNYILNGSGKEKKGFFTNFSSIDEDGYCVHTLSSKNTYTSVSIAPGILLKCRDYKTGSKVTWSYDIMYTNWNFPEGTDRREFWMGQRYTSPSWVGVTQHNLPVVGQNGCELNKWFHVEKTVTIPAQAAEGVGTQEGAIQFYNSNADVEASVTFKLKNIKLEYGNKATDWTPAPEDVDNKFKNYSTTTEMNSAIDQKADSITSSVSATYITKTDSANNIKNAINDIEIGGTNLWTGTKDFSTDAWVNMTHWLDSDEVYKGFAVKQRTGAWQGLSQDIEFNVGDVITFSGYVKKTAGAVFVYTGYGTGKTDKDGVAMNVANNDEWTYFNTTFKVTTAGTIRCRVENNTSDATIYVCGLKLEKGNKATDWTPALTDQDTEVIELKQKVTTLEQTSSGFNITISELSKFKTDTSSALEGINSDITDVNTELGKKQSAEDVSKAMETRLEEGVSKVITKTGYSFTQDGLVVSKTGSEMSTVIDEDGMTINRSGNEVLVADHDGVVAYNLHANTYLLVGTNSRFENYTNDNGEARTGCFWIG